MKLKEIFSARDMTIGAPWKRIAEFAVPMLIGNIAQQLYHTADTVIVGKYVGDNALSAVGSASPILNLLLAVFVGIATGAGIVISQNYGAKNRELLSESIGNCMTLAAIASVVIMIVGTLAARPLLALLGTPASIIDWCTDYLQIFFLGAVGFTFYNILSGILRGLGDSLSALGFLLVTTALNVGLDLLFVRRMGVAGVALATVLAQAVSAVLCLIKLMCMRGIFDLKFSTLPLRRRTSLRIIRIGLPSGLTQCIMAMAMLVVQSLTNSMGEMVIACSVIIMRVDGFAMMPNMTFGQTMSVYTGQNVGAGKEKRVEDGMKQGLIMSAGFSSLITIVLLFFSRYMFGFFTETPELINLAVRMMRILAAGYIAMAVMQVFGGIMRGAGDTMTPMWISIFNTIILRVPVAYGIAWLTRSEQYPNGSPAALYSSLLVTWVAGAALSYLAYRRGGWRKKMQEAMRLHEKKQSV